MIVSSLESLRLANFFVEASVFPLTVHRVRLAKKPCFASNFTQL